MGGIPPIRFHARPVGPAALIALGIAIAGTAALAEPPRPAPVQRPATAEGLSLVAVTTSAAQPQSRSFLQALRAHPWFVANSRRVRLLEVPSDGQAARLGLNICPAITAYGRGAQGLEMLGGRSGFAGADEAVEWLRTLDHKGTEARPAPVDLDVTLTDLERCPPLPSQQGYAPPAPVPAAPPPAVPASVPQPTMLPQSTPMMYTPVSTTTTASLIPAQTQSLMVQPAQVVMVPQVATTAMAGTTNLFMPSGLATAAVPTTMATASVPVAMAPASMSMAMVPASMPVAATAAVAPAAIAPAAAVATGPAVSGAAITTQSVSVPASRTSSRVRVRGPGPFASAAARFGERLTQLGRTRIETVQETQLETQVAQSPPGQFLTLSSTAATPNMPPQQNVTIPASVPGQPPVCQPPVCQPPPPPPQPQMPMPSPQTQQKHGLFGH